MLRRLLGIFALHKKILLLALMLFGALSCIGLSIFLIVRSYSESSSLFVSTVEAMQDSNETDQYLAMIFMAIGVAILVFIRKYWR